MRREEGDAAACLSDRTDSNAARMALPKPAMGSKGGRPEALAAGHEHSGAHASTITRSMRALRLVVRWDACGLHVPRGLGLARGGSAGPMMGWRAERGGWGEKLRDEEG